MALISRYNVLSRSPGLRLGGTTQSGDRANFGKSGAARNRFQSFARFNATPSGYVAPYAWIPAQVGGGMASFTILEASGTVTGSLAGGRNIEAALSASMTLTPPQLQLIVALAAALSASGTLTPPTLAGVLFASASITASGTLTPPTLGALISATAALSASGSLAATARADGFMEAAISNAASADAPTADANAAAVMAYVLENGLDVAGVLRVLLSFVAGDGTMPSGAGAYEFLAQDGTTPRIEGTISGDTRTVTTVDGSP
jgi:hypothetical protein